MHLIRGLLVTAITLLHGAVACESDDASSDTGDGSTALPACYWDASWGECNSARLLLSCRGPDDVVTTCLSDDPSGCPAPTPTDPSAVCENQCEPREYAVWCGGVGPGSGVPLPSDCRSLGALPSGSTLGCCPCEL